MESPHKGSRLVPTRRDLKRGLSGSGGGSEEEILCVLIAVCVCVLEGGGCMQERGGRW
jgi:hypothetical protein